MTTLMIVVKSNDEIDYQVMDNIVFKVIVLGHQGVGKTAMLTKYIKGEFTDQYNVTVGVEFTSKTVRIDDKTQVKLQIWDTAGQEAFRAIMRSFYKGICGIFFTFGIDNQESFASLDGWVREARENANEEAVLFLVGAKADLQFYRKVTAEQAHEYLKEIGAVFYIQTSSKTGHNIDLLFDRAAKLMHKKFISNHAFRNLVMPVMMSGLEPNRSESIRLTVGNTQKKKGCC